MEEIYAELARLLRKPNSTWEESSESFSVHVHKFFISRFGSHNTTIKSCESVILNFMSSIDFFKSSSPHCLLFGQLLAELYSGSVSIFLVETRGIIEEECGFKILSLLERKNGVEGVKIPYAKIRSIAGKFLVRGGVEAGVETFMEYLREKYPSVGLSNPSSTRSSV